MSVLAERLYSELERGRWSNMAGLCWWHVDLVRVSLREHSRAKVDAALDELERAGFVSVNRQVSAVFLPMEAQASAECGPNHRQGLRAIAQTFPSCAQVDSLLEIIANVEKGLPRATQALPKPSPLRNRSKEQDQKQDSSTATPAPDKPTPDTRFKPPTPDEAIAYFTERGSHKGEAEKFVDFYASKGWKVGKTPMKDWRAAVRNWLRDKSSNGGSLFAQPAAPDYKTIALQRDRRNDD